MWFDDRYYWTLHFDTGVNSVFWYWCEWPWPWIKPIGMWNFRTNYLGQRIIYIYIYLAVGSLCWALWQDQKVNPVHLAFFVAKVIKIKIAIHTISCLHLACNFCWGWCLIMDHFDSCDNMPLSCGLLIFLCSPAETLGITKLVRFLSMWPFSHHIGSHILTSSNGSGWRRLWIKKPTGEWADKAETDGRNKEQQMAEKHRRKQIGERNL